MSRFALSLAAVVALASCSGAAIVGPGGGGGIGDGGGDETDINLVVPESLRKNVEAMSYDADDEVLKVQIRTLDATPVLVAYDRAEILDVPGYAAFKIQEDALDRIFVALAAGSDDGTVQAMAIADGGQFGKHYGGTAYTRKGTFDAPPLTSGTPGTGQVSYAGDYAGVTNIPLSRARATNVALDVAPGTPAEVIPNQSVRVEGTIFLNANFVTELVNGTVYDREFADGVDGERALDSIDLVDGVIAEDGTFVGDVEIGANNNIGTFGGIFGGRDASSVAGSLVVENFDEDYENEVEYGVFVLKQCGQPGDAAICDQVATD